MADIRSVIILKVGVPGGAFDTPPEGRAEYTNALMAATAPLRIIAFQIARMIEKVGYKATIVPIEGSDFGYWYADRKTLKQTCPLNAASLMQGWEISALITFLSQKISVQGSA